MCTTFLCYMLAKDLLHDRKKRTELLDYPNLIRLNPNIPWKTRGNAALSLRIKSTIPKLDLFRLCKRYIVKFATSPRANSGLVIFEGEGIPDEIQDFSKRALYSVLGLREAKQIIRSYGIESFSLRSGQGLVGAIASIGNLLLHDHTFEIIAYRKETAKPRSIDLLKVIMMSKLTVPGTFSSYDSEYERVMITPHGPDPVLCGIRGETASATKQAFDMLLPIENLRGWMIFRSNQGTGEHLSQTLSLDLPKAYLSGKVIATVKSIPKSEIGGHVFFTIENEEGEIPCACYEPTASFRNYAKLLIPGDIIEVGGGIRKSTTLHPKILNLEYFKPIKLAKKFTYMNPECSNCATSMSSMGRGQGFRCKKCGNESKELKKRDIQEPRYLELERMYSPPLKAHRHLTKPEQRKSIKSKRTPIPAKLIQGWMS
ncbi:MAG: tRNA(Ile)(2)-agmatinylcytidine synthase [Nitrososphaerales archaeon]|jgi:tRNA(Ile2)-agmatinylcytidine synthase